MNSGSSATILNKYLCRMNAFESLSNVIRSRRSTKPDDMNGKQIDPSLVRQLLELANWAPTHGRTEPWRFIVHENSAVQKFCSNHAELYRANTPPEKFTEAKYKKLLHTGDTVSHIILVYMKRTENTGIPVGEELCAVAAAVENLLLGATSLDIAVLWSTGGMAHHPAMKEYAGLGTDDIVVGLLYLGYTDAPAQTGKRNIPLENKITWKK
jgi:nitroreductase